MLRGRTRRRRGWHREAIGGLWDEIGELQFRFLLDSGLKPTHALLDIGCGSLRGGRHFVAYLDPGNYVGVDRDSDLLAAGLEHELGPAVREAKRPHLVAMGDFGFGRLGRTFDFALAQSVFTHLPLNDIVRCLVSTEPVLAPGGALYATYFENPKGKRKVDPILHQPGGIISYFDRDPFHYDLEAFRWACEGTALEVERIGGWGHPRDQRMLVFRKLK